MYKITKDFNIGKLALMKYPKIWYDKSRNVFFFKNKNSFLSEKRKFLDLTESRRSRDPMEKRYR